ncbi:MAG TPA: hypothetical protein VK939_15745 [Longimicrobiales bacterium]|nr:hypothetical protein [Longimicrobiales bacterium]
MFISRERRGPDRWLYYKLALFAVGAVIAVLGVALGNDLLVTIAIGVLFLGLLTRLLPRGEQPEDGDRSGE